MKKPKLVVYDLVQERPRVWVLNAAGEATILRGVFMEHKESFVSRCAAHCRFHATVERPLSLRVHAVNGRILEERTYPRSADPRRSKG